MIPFRLIGFSFLLLLVPSLTHASNIFETFSFIKYVLLEGLALIVAIALLGFIATYVVWKLKSKTLGIAVASLGLVVMFLYTISVGLPEGLQFPSSQKTFGPGNAPGLTLSSIYDFFTHLDQFERVNDIAEDPRNVPLSRGASSTPETVEVFLETKEVLAEMGPEITMNYWTFNGKVPGPMIRVKEGDMVKLTLTNHRSSLHHHNIDLHAVTGPGGGAVVTHVAPGETKSFSFQALNPGLYVYHCAVANVPNHMAHGMYGMILVEPKEGMPPVDQEFYVMQGELYSTNGIGNKGLQVFDTKAMQDGVPTYVVFNGKTNALEHNMHARVGDKIRIYFGNGGVNLVSSFHVIGEIFDTVYPEGSIGGALLHNVQTTLVPAGGATITEFTVEYPGNYMLVDHALSRLDKGAWGMLEVSGEKDTRIFDGDFSNPGVGHGH